MSEKIQIPYVAWRNGRPRFEPSATLRKAGHKGHDLKSPAGAWMTVGQALDWSKGFSARIEADRRKARDRKAKEKKQAVTKIVAAIPKAAVKISFTLGQLLEQWISGGTRHNAPGTIKTYRAAIRAISIACPAEYYTEAAALQRREIRAIHKLVAEEFSDDVAHMAVVVMRVAYNWALDDDDLAELIETNPVHRVKTKKPTKRERAATVAEYLHLLATAERMGEDLVYDMILWGVWTAQRAGDRLAMTWANIRENRIELKQQKTGAKVSIGLSAAIRARLPALKPNRRTVMDLDTEGAAERLQYYWRHFHMVIDEAAKTMPSVEDILDRDLRRTASSWMGMAGCTIPEIFSITGHKFSNETAIMGHYMAIDLQIADNAIAKLEAWYASEVQKLEQRRKAG